MDDNYYKCDIDFKEQEKYKFTFQGKCIISEFIGINDKGYFLFKRKEEDYHRIQFLNKEKVPKGIKIEKYFG